METQQLFHHIVLATLFILATLVVAFILATLVVAFLVVIKECARSASHCTAEKKLQTLR